MNNVEIVVGDDGSTKYLLNGKLHRLDGPAEKDATGECWWVNGERHRDDGLPACEYAGGSRAWWVNGKLHRLDDNPAIFDTNGGFTAGSTYWFVNGERHRDYGLPAYCCWFYEPDWYWHDVEVRKERAFGLAIDLRRKKFGLILFFCPIVEDDVYFLIKLNWK